MREFTAEELAENDGREGHPAYVAYKGIVYDMSGSDMWVEGEHEAMHFAGRDLTVEQEVAPHDELVLDFPEVGRLV